MGLKVWAMALLALTMAACGPQTADLKAGERGTITRVFDGDTFELDGTLRVHLVGVEAPWGEGDAPAKARAAFERLALHRKARLEYGGTERYTSRGGEPAALAQVFIQTEGGRWVWAQEALLRDGHARVRTRKDNVSRSARMLAAEAAARAEKRGLWAERRFAVRTAGSSIPEGFQVVEGAVRSIGRTEAGDYLNFGEDIATDFTVRIAPDDAAAFDGRIDVEQLEGQRIRVRGYVVERGGPLIRVDHPEQIELL